MAVLKVYNARGIIIMPAFVFKLSEHAPIGTDGYKSHLLAIDWNMKCFA